MTNLDFLARLWREGKLELVEPSNDICLSYLEKAENCLKSAKILLQNKLYDNSITMSYYAMYNSLTAVLFKTGIKCENHSGAILLLKFLFNKNELFKVISEAKEERIDKQYYVQSKQLVALTENSTKELFINAESFLIQIKSVINNLTNGEIKRLRDILSKLI
ncbi:MAG: HEPN domain-containing protein [DPANN group archaeon]|nr:HEPN domain-containing protein [DPANN group archaeon]